MKPLVVLSLFDGMSCGLTALKRAGIPVKTYYASEIDKYAITVAQKNHPEIIQLGDVEGWKEWDIESPDLIIGGSPCQGFSFAGKQLAFDDPRSRLFFTMMDIINHFQPRFRLLENVKMKKEFLAVISEKMGTREHFIDSALVSAQNRRRYYWYNWFSTAPDDKNILLEDIIESGFVDRDKSYCIAANYFKGGNPNNYFNKKRRQLVFINQRGRGNNKGGFRALNGKCPTLTPSRWEQNNKITTDGGYSYRKLTPIECERLQTLPDGYTEGVSNTQRYRMLGNGWTVDVIAHLFKSLKESL